MNKIKNKSKNLQKMNEESFEISKSLKAIKDAVAKLDRFYELKGQRMKYRDVLEGNKLQDKFLEAKENFEKLRNSKL